MASKARFTNESASSIPTPPTGDTELFINVTDKLLTLRQDDGTLVTFKVDLPFDAITDPATDAAVTTAIIDDNDGIVITTTTAGNDQTLASPTDTTAGKRFLVINNDTSTNSISINSTILPPANFIEFVWDGDTWISSGIGGGSGDVIGPLSSTTNAFPRFSDTDGKILKDSPIVSDDSGNVSGQNNTTQTGYSDIIEIASPANPATDVGRLYTKDDGGITKLYFRNSAGTETELTLAGSVVPAGSDTEIQVNDGGVLSAFANFIWQKLTNTLQILGNINQQGGTNTLKYTPTTLSTLTLGTNPRFSVAVENYVFVVDNGSDDLKIIDVSDPAVPFVVGSVVIPTSAPRGVDVAGRYVYVADATGAELVIIDHIDKSNPVIISTLALTGTGSLRGIKVSGNTAFLTSNSNDFTSVDVTDVNNPIQLETLTLSDSSRTTFDIIGKYAYLPLANPTINLQIVDISDPSNMVLLDAIDVGGNEAFEVKVEGRYAHVLSGTGYVIVDISDPNNLSIKSTLSMFSSGTTRALFLANGFGYIADSGGDNLRIVDARDETAPVEISNPLTLGTNPVSITIVGRHAYCLDNGSDQLFVVDIGGTELQSATIGSAYIGDLQVRGEMNVAKRVKTESVLVGVGGVLSNGPVASEGFILTKKGFRVIEITQESDFKAVGGIINPPFTKIQYKMLASVATSSRFVVPTGGTIVFTAPFQDVAELTYTGTGTLITASDLSDLRIDKVNILNSGSGTLFDITGVTSPATIVMRDSFIAGFASLGSITGMPIMSVLSTIFAENADGFTLTDTNFAFDGIQYINSTDTSSTLFTITGTSNILADFTKGIITLHPNETMFNISSGIGSSSSLFIKEITRTLGPDSGTVFDVAGINETDIRMVVRDVDGVSDSTTSAELTLTGNTATTDIPAQNAFVEINTDVNWTSTDVERINADVDGTSELTNPKDVKLKSDGNTNLEPTSGGAQDLSVRTMIAQPTETTVTFTNGTNLINETSTPRLVNDLITFRDTAGTLPAEIRDDIVFHVINVTVNAFQVSYTQGGPVITFTDDGTPTNSYKVCELHGSTPVNTISSGSPRDISPHATVPAQTGSKTFLVIQNTSGTTNIDVNSGYQRLFE